MLTPSLRDQRADRREQMERALEIGVEREIADAPTVEQASQGERVGARRIDALTDQGRRPEAGGGEDRRRLEVEAAAGIAEMAWLGPCRGRKECAILLDLSRELRHLLADIDMAMRVELDVEAA